MVTQYKARLLAPIVASVIAVLAPSPASAAPPSASPASGTVRADFNGDGREDVAIGVPLEDFVPGKINDGAVNVIYGTGAGLKAPGNQLWGQDSPGIGGVAKSGDEFGRSLAAGDFNGDGFADLAVGVPFDDVAPGKINDGAVNVIYGSRVGLTATGNQVWGQNSPGIEGVAESGDELGFSLTSGDYNGDGRSDLAIGLPLEDTGGRTNDGGVSVIYGSANRLTAAGSQLLGQDSPGIAGVAESGDELGLTLTSGDFNGDRRSDLAVGVPLENFAGGKTDDGAVNVIYGSANRLTATGNQVWGQGSPGILGAAETGDQFGRSLTASDYNGDGRADLAVGVPLEDFIGGKTNDGAVNVIYGSANRLTATGNQVWGQGSPGVLGAAESFDEFGLALSSGDYNGDGRADLAVGVPLENFANGKTDDGAVNVIYGSTSRLRATGNQVWGQDSPGILGAAESFDEFGLALSSGDYNGDGRADLAIGVPLDDVVFGKTNDGAVNVIYGSANRLNATGNQVWSQGSPGILGSAESGDEFGLTLAVRTR
jgi:hypothetical protein